MQFVKNGPDIPERLLQAHEEERVVFFCGAGISYPARLPGFSKLVDKLYEALSVTPNAVQQAAIRAGQFDTSVGLLEEGIIGDRQSVRKALSRILTPNLDAPNATATQEALLTLGKNRSGRTRLITTNFDRLFEEVIAAKSLKVERYQAPLLPLPKNHWDGLVYLHGLLSETPTPRELDRLVVSSGDFGLAYLTERWAARFVSEMFRSFTVCFVGYSINDPVLRYMMDALAADRLLGEPSPEMFAFGSYSKGRREDRSNEWMAKNVTPILYREHNRHSYLHKTLRAWAETYRDGVRGKERIVSDGAIWGPLASTTQDDFVGRVLWALSDPSGLPAKYFAELNPVPSLDWLKPLSDERYRHADLSRFGVQPRADVDENLKFSLTRRPSPYRLTPLMALATHGAQPSRLDKAMWYLASWLIRHLGDPVLLLWLVKQGGQLHDDLVWLIERRLDELTKLERDGDTQGVADIRAKSPKAVPGPHMRTLWRFLLTSRVQQGGRDLDLYRWIDRFKRDGLTTTLRLELHGQLSPRVSLREPFRWKVEDDGSDEPVRIKELVEWEIVLTTSHARSVLHGLSNKERWISALPELLADFSALLRDALDLKRELGGADDTSDLSYLEQPSISEHPQNKRFHEWTILIDLLRDAWLAMAAQTPERARLAAEGWWFVPYPLFRRLAFFAGSEKDIISPTSALGWLLTDERWWLWSVETRRETMRLLVALTPRLDARMLEELVQAVLAGPPRSMFNDDIGPEAWTRLVARETWLRLKKIDEAGGSLGAAGKDRLDSLSAQYPQWKLDAEQREEFSTWMETGFRAGTVVGVPRSQGELMAWLRVNIHPEGWQESDWKKLCHDDFNLSSKALLDLAKEDTWPTERWREALQVWSDEGHNKQSWSRMAPVLVDAPTNELQNLAHSVGWWLESVAKSFEGHEEHFVTLARRILMLDYQAREGSDDAVMSAINHPVGHATQALLNWWFRRSLEDGQGLPKELENTFSEICDTRSIKLRNGRVLLAADIIVLFRVDRDWTRKNLLPLFDWERSCDEACAAWSGFLRSPRLYLPLFEEIKSDFLATSRNFDLLGRYKEQYAYLLTYAALDLGDVFSTRALANATQELPEAGLRAAIGALIGGLEGAGDQRSDYWTNRVVPYLRTIWPKTKDKVSPAVAEKLGLLCVAAEEGFPEAVTLLRGWLQPVKSSVYVVHQLLEAKLCDRFPEPALDFLSLLIGEFQRAHLDLKACLEAISAAAPELGTDGRLQTLQLHVR